MLAHIFIVEGVGKIGATLNRRPVKTHGVDGRLLLLVILTKLGGGVPVLFDLKMLWAANTFFAFAC